MARKIEGIVAGEDGLSRCWWGASTPDYARYHDSEWGFPVKNDERLFEKISLEGFQAGLSWLTILRKRENFRKAFAQFDFGRAHAFRSPDHRLQPRLELGQIERLGEVVVSAEVQAPDAVLEITARRQDHDRARAATLPKPLQHDQPVHRRQRQVEHDRVVVLGAQQRVSLRTVAGLIDRVAVALQGLAEPGGELQAVFDEQQAHVLDG